MEAHNCEHAGVHVPCEIVMQLGDLGAGYMRERASRSLRSVRMSTTNHVGGSVAPPPPDYTSGLVLDDEIGAARNPTVSRDAPIVQLEESR